MVKVYLMSVGNWEERELKSALSRLPGSLREKSLRNRRFRDQALSAASSLLLDRALKDGLGSSVLQAELGAGPYGKPFLKGAGGFQFSITHSGEYAACAAGDCPVGVDVEQMKADGRDILEIAKRFFHRAEYEQLRKSPDPTIDFYRLWTLKESYLKFLGEGLHRPLNSFCVLLGIESRLEGCDSPRFAEWGEIPGYKLSLCCEAPEGAKLIVCDCDHI